MEKHLDLASIVDFKGLKIKLSSPETIKSWSYGEVTKPETINYRTLKPEKDGLFSENIFGPTKDWECYCGKYKRIRYRGIICDKCGVEVTQSKVRRERMGHISLACPVTHVWFFKGAPSKLSLILDVSPRDLESVIYFAKFLVIDLDEDKRKKILGKLSENEKDKRKDLEKSLEEKIKEQEKEKNAEIKTVESKIKAKEQRELAIQEVELKCKQKISSLRDEHSLEETRLEEIFKTISDLVKSVRLLSIISEEELLKLDEYEAAGFIRVGMGAEAVLEILKKLDLQKLCADLRNEVHKTSGQRQIKARKRLLILEGLRKAEVKPEWMILQILPVIPPDLRPMVQLSGGRFATSDLNDLYRRVINRNNRLKHLMDLGAPEIILRNEKRMLQEAVDSLIDTPQRLQGRPLAQAQVLRSLSEMLRGKQGRFRQNLLGKRVDYSGRSVIVVGPELKLNECGLPKEMALEMFKPFVLRELIIRGLAPNVKNAKRVLEKRPPEIFDILEDITKNHPVLLNRAPTLHRLGIQAFFPILTEGNAIRIHPAICAGFNADFDGDQMAIHVPLSKSSQEEAIHLMMPNTNLLRPADGTPITIPNKEMALGCYFFTYMNDKANALEAVFTNSEEAIYLYQTKKLSLHQKIRVKINGEIMETSVGRLIFNEYLPEKLKPVNANVGYKAIKSIITKTLNLYPNEVATKLIDDLESLGFLGSTLSGSSFSVSDCTIIPQKDEIISEADTKVAEIERNAKRGLITYEEMRHLEDQVWIETTDKLADLTWASFDQDNPIRTIVASEASRASKDQVKQLSAMRGLNLDPVGRTIRLPTKSNFREGLSVFEYLSVTRGSRKGLTDTALRTADAGYLTRRLIDVAHDAIMRSEDCGSTEGIEIERHDPVRPEGAFVNRISGRITAKKITDPADGRKILLKEGEEITEEKASLIDKSGVEKVIVRSPLTCQAKYGMCIKCYGRDLGTRKDVEIGTPVGIIAAQSIGEPGTQLTMRTKHTGGIMAVDVTQGLPRVEELFEVRTPKVLSPIAEIAGKVEVVETPEGYKVRIQSVGIKPVEEREYIIPLTSQLKVKDNELVTVGQQLASGYLDIKEVLAVKGLRGAQRYLIDEIQAVYESQGIPINDKHFEVIVRKMSEKVRIESSGDTNLFPGELIDKSRFEGENAKVIAEGGEPAIAQVVILGVSKASLYTESWLSAASFQETTNVLTEAAIQGKEDKLLGLKENVIIGRLIPTSPERAMMEPD